MGTKGVRSHCLLVDGLVAVHAGEALIPGQADGPLTRFGLGIQASYHNLLFKTMTPDTFVCIGIRSAGYVPLRCTPLCH